MIIYSSQHKKNWLQTFFQAWSTLFDLPNKEIYEIKIIFATNQLHTMQSKHSGKQDSEKKFQFCLI